MDNPDMSSLLDLSISATSPRPAQSSVTAQGLTNNLVRLLSSPTRSRRQWALAQLPSAARRPLSLEQWRYNGIEDEVRRLYEGDLEVESEVRWEAVKALLKSNSLSLEALQHGLLGTASTPSQKGFGRGIMSSLSSNLGGETECELILSSEAKQL